MADTRSHGWREHVADWITDGTLATLRAEKSIAAQMVARPPARAAALRDVETLLRSVSAVYPGDDSDACGYFYVSRDEDFSDGYDLPAFAALIVDRVLGGEQDG